MGLTHQGRVRPLLLVDVDGPLNPVSERPQGFLARRRVITALIPVDPSTGITAEQLSAAETALS
jgi:hypothetical protein